MTPEVPETVPFEAVCSWIPVSIAIHPLMAMLVFYVDECGFGVHAVVRHRTLAYRGDKLNTCYAVQLEADMMHIIAYSVLK